MLSVVWHGVLMGKRDEARAETAERILAAARAEIAKVGGVGLSMRSVARDVGMVSSAVYRYFPTREDLLTALILESYGALAEALRDVTEDAATATVGSRSTGEDVASSATLDGVGAPAAECWRGLADALRAWALRGPHEFQLIYGTPIPGYVAPPATVPAAAAVAAPFLACVNMSRVDSFESVELDGTSDGLRVLAEEYGISVSAAAAVVAAISELVGFVGNELAGHFVGLADPAGGLYLAVVGRQVRDLGLRQEVRH